MGVKHGNPYEFDEATEKRGLVWMALTILLALTLAVAFCWIDRQNAIAEEAKPKTYSESYSPGQPLDRVRMTAPEWSTAEDMYMMVHRGSGACWIYIELDGKWQVLPICDGNEYAQQEEVK